MDDDPAPRRGLLFWVAVGGAVVAAGGALYLASRTKRGKKATARARKAMARLKGGLLTAVLAGAANRAGQVATSRAL